MQSMFDCLEYVSLVLRKRFTSQSDKCHLNASSKVLVDIQISTIKVTSESRVKLLGIHIYNRENFDYHVSLP